MRKKLLTVLVLGLVFTLSACTGLSQSDFDALNAEKSVLEGQVDTLNGEKTALQDELDSKMVGYTNQSVEAYAYTHSGYVGQVKVVVTDGVIDVEINEAFMPHTLAAVKLSTVEAPTVWDETNTTAVGSSFYPTYIMYNDGVFKALATEAGFLVYSSVDATGALKTGKWDVKNLEMDIIKSEVSMKAYYDALTTGGLKLMKSLVDTTPVLVSEGQFKDGNPNYWQANTTSFGWQGNIDTLEVFLEENGAAFDTLSFTKVETTINDRTDTYWQIGDIVTGATNSSFQEYFVLAQIAFGKLVTEVK